MNLDQYRRKQGLSLDQLAAKLGIEGVNPARTVQRYAAGERIPDRAMIRHIAAVTRGQVTAEDFPDRPVRRARGGPTEAQDAA